MIGENLIKYHIFHDLYGGLIQFLEVLNREIKRPNVGLEDQNCLYVLGKTFSELVLGNR